MSWVVVSLLCTMFSRVWNLLQRDLPCLFMLVIRVSSFSILSWLSEVIFEWMWDGDGILHGIGDDWVIGLVVVKFLNLGSYDGVLYRRIWTRSSRSVHRFFSIELGGLILIKWDDENSHSNYENLNFEVHGIRKYNLFPINVENEKINVVEFHHCTFCSRLLLYQARFCSCASKTIASFFLLLEDVAH